MLRIKQNKDESETNEISEYEIMLIRSTEIIELDQLRINENDINETEEDKNKIIESGKEKLNEYHNLNTAIDKNFFFLINNRVLLSKYLYYMQIESLMNENTKYKDEIRKTLSLLSEVNLYYGKDEREEFTSFSQLYCDVIKYLTESKILQILDEMEKIRDESIINISELSKKIKEFCIQIDMHCYCKTYNRDLLIDTLNRIDDLNIESSTIENTKLKLAALIEETPPKGESFYVSDTPGDYKIPDSILTHNENTVKKYIYNEKPKIREKLSLKKIFQNSIEKANSINKDNEKVDTQVKKEEYVHNLSYK